MSNQAMKKSFSERVEEEMAKRRMEKEAEDDKKDLKEKEDLEGDKDDKMSEEEPHKKSDEELEEDPKKDLGDGEDEDVELTKEEEKEALAAAKRHKKKKMEERDKTVDREVVRAMGGINIKRLKDLGPEIDKKLSDIQKKLDELKGCKLAIEPMKWSNLQEELYKLNQELADLKLG